LPSATSAVLRPPPAPWTRIVDPAGRSPRRTEARGRSPAQLGRLGDHVACRHRDPLREGPVDAVGKHPPARIERLVSPARVGIGDQRIDDHLVALGVDARPVGPEHARQPRLLHPDAAHVPDVVMIERRRAKIDRRPPLRDRRRIALGDLHRAQRVGRGRPDERECEHGRAGYRSNDRLVNREPKDACHL
jgi:hypothetical protein